ncbi:unnamed protein product [Polarella glacialis]|uniref:Uncharacterized protein n=1 Tax=Polarella glacialis TaxID=89957 RepID=A0A813M1R2_POLGL|nr:unnamed protein product [Polarella glacialis]
MADYIRRVIRPLLPGLSSEVLEMIVGILEISGESREVDPDDREDIVEALMDGQFCVDDPAAEALVDTLIEKVAAGDRGAEREGRRRKRRSNKLRGLPSAVDADGDSNPMVTSIEMSVVPTPHEAIVATPWRLANWISPCGLVGCIAVAASALLVARLRVINASRAVCA